MDWYSASRDDIVVAANALSLQELLAQAADLRDRGHGPLVSYSRKVFIPLTELCRDVCHYCTYAKTPRRLESVYLQPEQVLDIARAGQAAGCHEALFTLGDKPELRYRAARDALAQLGFATTLNYLGHVAQLVLDETGLLPHLNPGVLSHADYAALRSVAPSMGIMLESASPRLGERGGPHFGSPDKDPTVRLKAIDAAGQAMVPLTTGILIGIGESRDERIDSLLALRESHRAYGHIQEIIVQNFVPKPGTKMANAPAPDFDELLWTIAAARLLFGPDMSIQAPPNLNPGRLTQLIDAGINDWGGVSPVTPDHVNPESPWPQLDELARQTATAGKILIPRLTVYPRYIEQRAQWIDARLLRAVLRVADASGYAREDDWAAGLSESVPFRPVPRRPTRNASVENTICRAVQGDRLTEQQVTDLFRARGEDMAAVFAAADELRRDVCGDTVTFAVNRNINYTNLCQYKCRFCAFSKGKTSEDLRGAPYVLAIDEITRRSAEAWERGATEVCLQGGIHPDFTGRTYLDICHAIRSAVPDMHIHAFSALEVSHGASTLGISIKAFLEQLRHAGLDTLPGTAAEILDDEVRQVICPDKLNTREWLDVIRTAHHVGLRTTSTIMFGHVERPEHWARHLLALRDLQAETGGITEFVPLPFVHLEAPMYRRGQARPGPTYREALLMHAVARLALHPLIANIQVSWVKLGPQGVADGLRIGGNDLGGTLMNESISRAAGASHGQEMPPLEMERLIKALHREPRQRTTLYGNPTPERIACGRVAEPLCRSEQGISTDLLYRRSA
ncbi:MAG: 5-amino-6-(D-ribitylamino)uracil--L-tyrosine 4-hydroxyphenyl transferase CofH [Gammaproteobacteria bacterium]|nr:5-amino-6-(D-ribitylamino)uracil--L-tyrosine 4-hydroxyphenyl transferase CofH [Gammaproteobacteria bacterium]